MMQQFLLQRLQQGRRQLRTAAEREKALHVYTQRMRKQHAMYTWWDGVQLQWPSFTQGLTFQSFSHLLSTKQGIQKHTKLQDKQENPSS